jgi:hypothetical protein
MPSDALGAQPPPSVVIVVPLEGAPRVICDYLDDGAERRMLDWLEQRPELLALIRDALELAEAA